jgi:hypothetical protein
MALVVSMDSLCQRQKNVIRYPAGMVNIAREYIFGYHQSRFRHGKLTIDQIFCISQILEK